MSHVRVTEEALRRAQVLSERGMRRASEALAALLGRAVPLDVSGVGVLPPGRVLDLLAGATADGMAVLRCWLSGEVRGDILLLLPLATVWRMLEALLGTPAAPRPLSEQEASALQEVANILASSFLSELGNGLGRRMMHSPPLLRFGKVSDLVDTMRQDGSNRGGEILVVQARFVDPGHAIEGCFFVLPELLSLREVVEGPGEAAEATA